MRAYLILARYVTEHKREAGTAWGATSRRQASDDGAAGQGLGVARRLCRLT